LKKEDVVKKVTAFSDAIITYRSENSKKLKYNICTLDFSTPYIKRKHLRISAKEGELIFFCWDTDSFRKLKYRAIVSVNPLSALLGG